MEIIANKKCVLLFQVGIYFIFSYECVNKTAASNNYITDNNLFYTGGHKNNKFFKPIKDSLTAIHSIIYKLLLYAFNYNCHKIKRLKWITAECL